MKIAAAAIVLAACAWTLAAENDLEALRERMLDDTVRTRERLTSRVAMTTAQRTVLSPVPGGQDEAGKVWRQHYVRDGKRYAYWLDPGKEPLQDGLYPSWTRCDGTVQLTGFYALPSVSNKGWNVGIVNAPGEDEEGASFTSLAPLQFRGYHDYGVNPEEALKAADSVIEDGGDVGGLRTVKVTYSRDVNRVYYTISLWLAPERGGAPVALELYQEGRRTCRQEWSDIKEAAPGIWVAGEFRYLGYDKEGNPVFDDVKTCERLDLSPSIDETVFNTSLSQVPDGARVYDGITGFSYTKGKGAAGSEDVKKVAESFAETDVPEMLAASERHAREAQGPAEQGAGGGAQGGQAGTATGAAPKSWLAAAAAALVLVCIAAVVYARRRG